MAGVRKNKILNKGRKIATVPLREGSFRPIWSVCERAVEKEIICVLYEVGYGQAEGRPIKGEDLTEVK